MFMYDMFDYFIEVLPTTVMNLSLHSNLCDFFFNHYTFHEVK